MEDYMRGNFMQNNDDRIIELKKLIEKKEKEIVPSTTAVKTTLILNFAGEEYNLNVIGLSNLQFLWCELESLRAANEKLNGFYPYPLIISGYPVDDWLDDIVVKMKQLMIKRKKIELNDYKKQLDKLLSEGKKTELLLDEIMEKLK